MFPNHRWKSNPSLLISLSFPFSSSLSCHLGSKYDTSGNKRLHQGGFPRTITSLWPRKYTHTHAAAPTSVCDEVVSAPVKPNEALKTFLHFTAEELQHRTCYKRWTVTTSQRWTKDRQTNKQTNKGTNSAITAEWINIPYEVERDPQ